MKKLLDPYTYQEQELSCDACGWKGVGADAILIDYYGVSDIKELHCPNCDTVIATIKSAT